MPGTGRVDVQHHFIPHDYVRAVGAGRIGSTMVSGTCPDWSAELSLAAMDRNGVSHALLSLAAPGFHFDDAANAAALTRLCNDEGAAHAAATPTRFGFLASLPLPHVDAALEELDRALGTLRADGICLLSNYGGVYLGDARLRPVLEALNRRRAVVFVHPAEPPSPALPHFPAATLEFPFDTTRALTNLVFSGDITRFPDIRFIFAHAGGTIPFLAERISRLERRPDFAEQVPGGALAQIIRQHYDIALSASPRTLKPLLDLVPAGNILWASDFPFAGEDTMAATARLLPGQGLSGDTVHQIEWATAARLFPAFLQTARSGG